MKGLHITGQDSEMRPFTILSCPVRNFGSEITTDCIDLGHQNFFCGYFIPIFKSCAKSFFKCVHLLNPYISCQRWVHGPFTLDYMDTLDNFDL